MSENALPIVLTSAITAEAGVSLLQSVVVELEHLFREQPKNDFGIDAVIELTAKQDGQRVATGRQIAVQIKAGPSSVNSAPGGFVLYLTRAKANYWLTHSLPVIVVYCESGSGRCRWALVSRQSLRPTPNGYSLFIPESSELRLASEDLALIAGTVDRVGRKLVPQFLLPFSERDGLQLDQTELGLACAEFAQHRRHGRLASIAVEIEGHAAVVAQEAVLSSGDIKAKQEALLYREILHRYERKADQLSRCFDLLFGNPSVSGYFFVDTEACALAARRVADGFRINPPRDRVGIRLEAWPSEKRQEPSVKFDLSEAEREDFFKASGITYPQLALGPYGGVNVFDLGQDLIASRFLPAFVRALQAYADRKSLTDSAALDELRVEPMDWQLGLA